MPYTAPAITASGATFAQFQSAGLHGLVDLVVAANPGLTQAQINIVHRMRVDLPRNAFGRSKDFLTNWLHGDPLAAADAAQLLLDHATAYAVILQALNEVGTLMAANPGTLGPRPVALTGLAVRRTWP